MKQDSNLPSKNAARTQQVIRGVFYNFENLLNKISRYQYIYNRLYKKCLIRESSTHTYTSCIRTTSSPKDDILITCSEAIGIVGDCPDVLVDALRNKTLFYLPNVPKTAPSTGKTEANNLRGIRALIANEPNGAPKLR